MKLSKSQEEVLRLMGEGWELGRSMGYGGYCWLQKNGLGRGGLTENVNFKTLWALQDRGLIEVIEEKYPTARYRLAKEGQRYVDIVIRGIH